MHLSVAVFPPYFPSFLDKCRWQKVPLNLPWKKTWIPIELQHDTDCIPLAWPNMQSCLQHFSKKMPQKTRWFRRASHQRHSTCSCFCRLKIAVGFSGTSFSQGDWNWTTKIGVYKLSIYIEPRLSWVMLHCNNITASVGTLTHIRCALV